MANINISNLTFAYDGSYDNVFENVSFQLDTDWKLGFIGRNGRGKTTFLRLLMGEYEYSGTISSAVSFGYFPFDVIDKTQNTLDIIESIAPDSAAFNQWQINRELSLLEVNEDVLYRPFETLSNEGQTKVLLVGLFLKENNFLLIDEPTNHLDSNDRAVICDYLKSKSGFILVSHDRNILNNCIDHVLSINKANIEVQRGNFSSWPVNKERQDGFELAENERLQKDIKRLSKAARQTSDWSDKVEKSKNATRNSGLRSDRGFIGHMFNVDKGIVETLINTEIKAKFLFKQADFKQLIAFSKEIHQEHFVSHKSKLDSTGENLPKWCEFADKGKLRFMPSILADYCAKNEHVFYCGENYYFYHNGVYAPRDELAAQQRIRSHMAIDRHKTSGQITDA
jgi:ATPase subunit of ABC transporter with duplicated ATPase domains